MQKNKDFKFDSVLFLGVGGASMHQLALALKTLGVNVFGYDAKKSENTKKCEENGIVVKNKLTKDFLNVDLCIKTAAVSSERLLIRIKDKKIPILDRADVLGWLCSKFKTTIAVAGTHGKTTTSALIYEILRTAGKKVSCHIGGEIFSSRFNFEDEFIVVEACEFNKSFLKIFPQIAVVTNVEKEHMDCYENLFCLQSCFRTFIKRGKKMYAYDEKSTQFLKRYKNIEMVKTINLKISPKLKGEYNLKNISLAARVCLDLGVDEDVVVKVVNSFSGVKRRYEMIGAFQNSKVYIDYAHHPTEVKSFIKAFKEEYKNVQIVFQPHTFSRTEMFFKDFVEILKQEDNVCVFKEYRARENPEQGKSARQLFLKLKEEKEDVFYASSLRSLKKYLKTDSAIAFIGAGDINEIALKLIKQH